MSYTSVLKKLDYICRLSGDRHTVERRLRWRLIGV